MVLSIPTKATKVRDVLRGIRAEHPQPVKRAAALQLQALEACITGLQGQAVSTVAAECLRACRDQALILLGFWRAFRSDDLCLLQVEHIKVQTGTSLEISSPVAKPIVIINGARSWCRHSSVYAR